MSTVLEHDARASVLNGPSIDARAYATHERTDVLTQKYLRTSENLLSVPRAGGAGQNWAGVASDPNFAHPTKCRPVAVDLPTRSRVRSSVWLFSQSNAQGSTVDPRFENESRSLHQHRSPSHTDAEVGVSRHLSSRSKTQRREACTPLAGWHGKSSGSNPLRPPARARRPDVQGRLSLAAVFDYIGPYHDQPAIFAKDAPACLAWERASFQPMRGVA